MPDPALLHRGDADFISVDLDVLRPLLPEAHRGALDGGPVPAAVAAVLFTRCTDSYERRTFFKSAAVSGEGFVVERLEESHVTLAWLQRVEAVVRWHVQAGVPRLRVSARDDDDRVFVVEGEVTGDGVRALTDAANQLRSDLAAHGVRRRLRVVPDPS